VLILGIECGPVLRESVGNDPVRDDHEDQWDEEENDHGEERVEVRPEASGPHDALGFQDSISIPELIVVRHEEDRAGIN